MAKQKAPKPEKAEEPKSPVVQVEKDLPTGTRRQPPH